MESAPATRSKVKGYNAALIQEILKDIVTDKGFLLLIETSVSKRLVDLQEEVERQKSDILELQVSNDKKIGEITSLKERLKFQEHRMQKFNNSLDAQEQYSRRNCLRLFGCPEREGENIDDVIVDIASDLLKVNLQREDVERSHRVGTKRKKQDGTTIPRGIIIKFKSYRKRREILASRRQLKGKKMILVEDLTARNQELLKHARDHENIMSAWSMDGRIIALLRGKNKVTKVIHGMAVRKSRFCMLLLMGALGYIQLIYLMMRVDFQPSDGIFKNTLNGRDQRAVIQRKQSSFKDNASSDSFRLQNASSKGNMPKDGGDNYGKLQANMTVAKEINEEKHSNLETLHGAESISCPRKVHLWATNAGELGYSRGIHEIKCPGSSCDVQLSVDMTLETMQKNEALILFHWSNWDWETLLSHRPPGQKWVFYTLESPLNTKKHVVPPIQYYNNTYDYIMSFRYDSDFRADYGQYLAGKPQIEGNDTRNWAQNRSRLVVWMASNCKGTSWPRQDFVNRLARDIPVDMYGRCGNQTCKAGTEDCDRALKQHKFILALENSECTDYITEKFWIQALYREIVPIVFGPPRSDYEKVAPPNSFIHIQDFKTTRELGEFLKKVDADDALYNKYFEWKKKGSLKPYGGPTRNILCELGDRLDADAKAVRDGTYKPTKQKDWKGWWLDSCKKKGRVPN